MKKGFWIAVKDTIKKADVVLEILDARMPELTRNKLLEEYAADLKRPLILVINKADIVSDELIEKIKKDYIKLDSVIVSSKTSKGMGDLLRLIRIKSKNKNPKVALMGYPNTGKSSLINRLSSGGRARTSSESGFTRGSQLILGRNGVMFIDTPGVVPFRDRDEMMLGLMSGISPSKLNDPDIVATQLIKLFKSNNPKVMEKEYGIDMSLEPEDILEEFGKKMNMLKKGGIVDERRAAISLLTQWHSGKIRM